LKENNAKIISVQSALQIRCTISKELAKKPLKMEFKLKSEVKVRMLQCYPINHLATLSSDLVANYQRNNSRKRNIE